MKSEAPTPLETDLDIESDLVTVPRAPSAPRRCAHYGLRSPAMAAADHQTLGFSNEHGHAVAKTKELMACGHHSRSL